MTKAELRAAVAAKVANLSPTYCQEADKAICDLVLRSESYRNAETIFCYVGTSREINTMPLLHAALRDGKTLALPYCRALGVMEARQIRNLSDLVTGKYNILAPKLECPTVEPEAIDLAIVPCCTANERGQRLGYGGGFYDRYLPRMRCPKVALCRRHLVTEDIPMDDHDVTVDYLVTERGVADCKQIRF